MALGFSSRYQPDNQASFGSLTKNSINNDSESFDSSSNQPSLIVGHASTLNGLDYDNCEFSTSVEIDYSQYTLAVADGSCSETAGSVAYCEGSGSASFSGGGDCSGGASFSGGGGGGMSCASFTC